MQRSTALFCVLLVAGRAEAFLHGAPLLRLSRAAAPAAPRCLQPPRMVASPGKGDTAGGERRQGGEVVEGPFRGQFGSWVVDEADAAEVLTYRASLVAAALSVSAAATMAVVPGALPLGVEEAPAWAFDAAAAGFYAAFGVSLSTIHIYMKPMHNFLKALWAAGALGALVVLASSPSHSLVVESFLHPELLLASGWVFVALTGLFFKEWACFQRWEASALFALVPVLTGGHFLHILPQGLEAGLAAALAVMFPFFALRKFEQPLKADIGDKSIFEYFKRVERGELTEADMEVARRMGMRD